MPVRNPIEWSLDQARGAAIAIGANAAPPVAVPPPAIARISSADLKAALAEGYADFLANRTDVILLCVFYPVMGLLLARFASGEDTLPLLFPLIAGFALIGPLAATGLYEISRRREAGEETSWTDAFAVLRSPSLFSLIALGCVLAALFALWLAAAEALYLATIAGTYPPGLSGFATAVFTTSSGQAMIVAGFVIGYVFAAVVLAVGVVSFPMLVDRPVGIEVAVRTSLRAVAANPVTIALWGLTVAVLLAVAAIPLFVGFVVALPILGHATWHLYRRLVPV
jgi:uncharacterized membrane protein